MAERGEGVGGSEWRPGKATELDEALARRGLTPEEVAERHGERLELQMRADVPAIEVGMDTHARDVLDRLQRDDINGLALRTPDGEVAAMVAPVDRYLELVASDLKSGPKEATIGGRLVPTDAAYASTYVEQVNPGNTSA